MPKVSIILAVLNGEQTVRKAIESAQGQTERDIEIVVVDDGSSDRTAEIAERAGARIARDEHSRGGKGEAMRLAVQACSGELIVFLDGDVDPFPPHFVPGLLGPVLTDEDIALVKASYLRPLNGVPGEGGRVNDLVARPVIHHEQVSRFSQRQRVGPQHLPIVRVLGCVAVYIEDRVGRRINDIDHQLAHGAGRLKRRRRLRHRNYASHEE